MNAELIEPNLHVALVHFPVGLFVTGVLAEVAAALFRADSLRSAGRWMLLLGALASIPVSLSGVYAFADVVAAASGHAEGHWHEITTAADAAGFSAGVAALRLHTILQSIFTVVSVAAVLTYVGASDAGRRSLTPLLGVMIVAALGCLLAGAHVGGDAVYLHRAGVEAKGTTRPAPGSSAAEMLAFVAPPLQVHVVTAGMAIAVGLASAGLSFRNANNYRAAARIADGGAGASSLAVGRPATPEAKGAATAAVRRGPAGRVWLTSAGIAVAAALAGWWYLAREAGTYKPAELWENVQTMPLSAVLKPENQDALRRLAHVGTGGLLVGLPILMALISKWAPKHRWPLALLTAAYVLIVAGQVWFGVLLMYDQPVGPLTGFAGK